jgi:hypothetical protein
MENFGPFNHTARKLDPNMVFQAGYAADSSMNLAFTYACISRRLYSFNVLSRSTDWASADVEALVADANASTSGMLKVDGMRIADADTYAKCGL